MESCTAGTGFPTPAFSPPLVSLARPAWSVQYPWITHRRIRLVNGRYDAIVIGAGHNGLVTACYLAKAGKKVLVLERREVVGGACVTETPFADKRFKVSTASYVNSLFRKEIVHDLKLHDHGFAQLERNPSSFSPFLDGRYLMMSGDRA